MASDLSTRNFNEITRLCKEYLNRKECTKNVCFYEHLLPHEIDMSKMTSLSTTDFAVIPKMYVFSKPHAVNSSSLNQLLDNNITATSEQVPSNSTSNSSTMDEDSPATIIRKPCRYFRKGRCVYSELCQFSHDSDVINRNNAQRNRNGSAQNNRRNRNDNNLLIGSQPSTSNENPGDTDCASDNTLLNVRERNSPKMINKKNQRATSQMEEEEGACSPPLEDGWVNAPEFVPKQFTPKYKTYAAAANFATTEQQVDLSNNSQRKICPYVTKDGYCKYPLGECAYLHGDVCDLCQRPVLHPYNEELRKKHNQECIKQHEKDMELSFAVARSKGKSCGVCFEVVIEKSDGEHRFGILPNCNHCFCLTCIRKWRQARQFENNIIRACPECRVTSDFVCPSMYWVDTKEDKEKLITDYKNALAKKDCKYFNKGRGKCPFGNKCFYLHKDTNGKVVDVGPPPRQRRRRAGLDNDIEVLQQVILWDFLEERDNPWHSLADDFEDIVDFLTDSDESEWSDYDIYFD